MSRSYIRVGKHFGEKPNPKKEKEVRNDVIEMMKRNPVVGYIVSKAVEQVMIEKWRREDAI